MKLTEFSLDKELAELGPAPAPAPGAAPGAAPQQGMSPQQAPKGPDPRELAARAQEVAAQKAEIQQLIKQKQMEIVELQQKLASIK